MKYSELLDKIAQFRIKIEAAKEADLIDNNARIEDFEVEFVDYDGREMQILDIKIDLMGEPYRIMLIEQEEE